MRKMELKRFLFCGTQLQAVGLLYPGPGTHAPLTFGVNIRWYPVRRRRENLRCSEICRNAGVRWV